MDAGNLQKGTVWVNGHLGVSCAGGGLCREVQREGPAAPAPFQGLGATAHLCWDRQPGEEGRIRSGDLERGGRGHPAEFPGHLGTCLSLGGLAVLLAFTPTLAPKSLLGFWGEGTS